MRRSAKKKKKADRNSVGPSSDTPSVTNLGSAIVEDNAHDSDGSPSTARRRNLSPTGGPTTVTPKSAARRSSNGRSADDCSELSLLEAAEEREGRKIEIDSARLDIERDNNRRLAASEEKRLQLQQGKLVHEEKELELRKEKKAMDAKDHEARMKLDRERMEDDRADREAERASKEAAAARQDKLLKAVLSLVAGNMKE